MSNIVEFLRNLVYAVVTIMIVMMFFGAVMDTGLAPQPGDPFFPAWLDATRYGLKALILVIPGVGAATYVVLCLLPDSGGF